VQRDNGSGGAVYIANEECGKALDEVDAKILSGWRVIFKASPQIGE
jgi:hypothetical protein